MTCSKRWWFSFDWTVTARDFQGWAFGETETDAIADARAQARRCRPDMRAIDTAPVWVTRDSFQITGRP